jgi:Na+-transporting NADH:ubiquinone oxidoreductase subunit NqrD
MMIVTLGVTGSVMIEDPVNLMDDLGEGIKRSFWSVSGAMLREMYFQGTVVETTEKVSSSVSVTTYPDGLILLTQDQVDLINVSPSLVPHLTDSHYQLNRRIIRELLHDDSVKVTEIQEFVAL